MPHDGRYNVVLHGILSFPGGLVCLIISVIVCGLMGGEYPSGHFTAWLIMACGGCLQWYIIAPLLLQEPKLTLLNLNSVPAADTKSVIDLAVNEARPIESSEPIAAAEIQTPRKSRPRKRQHRVLAFDKFGRTPLERVINHPPRDVSA